MTRSEECDALACLIAALQCLTGALANKAESLPAAPGEADSPQLGEEAATDPDPRSLVECALADHLFPALETLRTAHRELELVKVEKADRSRS